MSDEYVILNMVTDQEIASFDTREEAETYCRWLNAIRRSVGPWALDGVRRPDNFVVAVPDAALNINR